LQHLYKPSTVLLVLSKFIQLVTSVIFILDMSAVSHHPSGVRVDIVSIQERNRGHSCEVHTCCGQIVALDTVLRLRKVQIQNGKCCTSHAHYLYCVVTDRLLSDRNTDETAIAAYWVTDGVNRCRVGFLPRHYVRQAMQFDGRLVQVVAMLADAENPRQRQFSRFNRGACHATVIDADFSRQEQQSSTVTGNGGNGSTVSSIEDAYAIALSVFEDSDRDEEGDDR
jgi:hypothetical protein